MKITIHGAGSEVTGSAFLLQTDRAKVLIDCGQFQGGRRDEQRNSLPRNFNPRELSAVVLTHGHLDHCGRLPLLGMRGYNGPVYATPATIDVSRMILKDAAKVQESDTERQNRKRIRAGMELLKPLFVDEDVDRVARLMRPLDYETAQSIAPGITAQMLESGHVLGSSIVRLIVEENGRSKTIVFSGDLGPLHMPILKDPARIEHADWVFMESTYGDRDHRPLDATVQEFYGLVTEAVKRNGKILVPSFALGRTQQMMYHLAEAFHKGIVKPFPVFIDSPLGIAATEIYARHPDLYDADMREFALGGKFESALKTIKFTQTADESKALNDFKGACLIMAGSGMCTAGRILHHLKHHLWQPETTVIFVGYQAPGSLGRMLIEGKELVSIYGEKIAVRATIRSLGGFSAHAGQTDLVNWFASVAPSRPRLTLIHGEDRGRKPLARLIQERFSITADLPHTGETLVG